MKTTLLVLMLWTAALCPSGLVAEIDPEAAAEPASHATRYLYNLARKNIIGGAEKMSAADYSYRPTPEVRSFAQLVAHIADTQYLFCSSARNEPNPNGKGNDGEALAPGDPSDRIETSLGSKAELVAALREVFAYCDPVFEVLVDAEWGDRVRLVGHDRTKASPLTLTLVHLWEHYGNMVTYMRLRGVVPVSSTPPAADSPETRRSNGSR